MEENAPIYSIAVPVHLLSDREVSATAKLLYGVIDSFQRKSGVCYATNLRLSEELGGCTPRTASKCVSELKEAGYIIVDEGKTRKIYLATSFPDGHEGRSFFPPSTKKTSRGVEENFQGGRRKFPPSISESNTESKTEKKNTIDPLPVFVEWIQQTFADRCSPDDKNALYLALVHYAGMRSESKSPLDTKRKVSGLLEDLLEGSGGNISVMCEMLKVARRRCWLSVHSPEERTQKPKQEERQYECR